MKGFFRREAEGEKKDPAEDGEVGRKGGPRGKRGEEEREGPWEEDSVGAERAFLDFFGGG